jgi:hypothetical protein
VVAYAEFITSNVSLTVTLPQGIFALDCPEVPMPNHGYGYENREGVLPVSWELFHAICKSLARAAAPYRPELILAVGRGGYYPGALLGHMLRVELFPVRLSRRVADIKTFQHPRWLLPPPASLRNQRLLIVDEISGSGETIGMVREVATALGAASIRSAVLYAHSSGVTIPDYIGIISDALILNPWDREIYVDGRFQWHPEYVQAMSHQELVPLPEWLEQGAPVRLAKG